MTRIFEIKTVCPARCKFCRHLNDLRRQESMIRKIEQNNEISWEVVMSECKRCQGTGIEPITYWEGTDIPTTMPPPLGINFPVLWKTIKGESKEKGTPEPTAMILIGGSAPGQFPREREAHDIQGGKNE